ncbi:Protein Iojap, chloroplastic [Linum grandiflorum]
MNMYMTAAGYPSLPIAGTGACTRYSGDLTPIIERRQLVNHCQSSATRKLCFSQGKSCTFALRKDASDDNFLTNAEDTDEEALDELFNKYGKVVFTRNDQQPLIPEVDDDAETLSFAVELAKVASDVKAGDIKLLFVKPLVYWTRFFIIATAFSRPQIDAIGSRIRDLAENKYGKVPSGDTKPNSWTLLDFGDVVVHIFLPPERDFYNLEEFYGNAMQIELPFENQSSQLRN